MVGQHGKPTRVNNYWETSGLNILETLAKLDSGKVPELIDQLLSARTNISAIYTRSAIKTNPDKVIETLTRADDLANTAEAFADYDYRMHHELAFACGNPIYVLTLNGFKGFYARIARHYFADARTRKLALKFFAELKALAEQNKFDESIFLVRKYGLESGALWQEIRETMPEDIMEQDA